jgi:RNAse (barnase) inhibitor barstar
MRVVRLDGFRIESKGDLLAAIATALDFPEYFGHKWDALDECLGEVTEPTVVEWGRFRADSPMPIRQGYETALRCFADTSAPVELRLVPA